MVSKKGSKMTMKRVEGETEEPVAPMKVRTPKKAGGGSVVVFDEGESNLPIEVLPNATTAVSDKMKDIVSVKAPEDSPEMKASLGPREMQEISYEEYVKSRQVALTNPSINEVDDATKRVNDLIGKDAHKARDVLEDMRGKKQLVSYRFLPIGMPMSMEVEPGRVQVLVDAAKKVVDISIS
jgi:hypothetical protein